MQFLALIAYFLFNTVAGCSCWLFFQSWIALNKAGWLVLLLGTALLIAEKVLVSFHHHKLGFVVLLFSRLQH